MKLCGEDGLINQVDDLDMVVIAKGVKSQESSRNYNQVKIQLVNRDGFSNLVVEAIAKCQG